MSSRQLPATEVATLARRVKATRLERGWSRQDLAERLGTSVRHVEFWEEWRGEPQPRYRAALAEVLGVTEAWLLGREGGG